MAFNNSDVVSRVEVVFGLGAGRRGGEGEVDTAAGDLGTAGRTRAAPEWKDPESATLTHGDLVIDAGRREVKVGADEIQLAPKEFDLLWELLDHRGLVLTRDQLLERVWGYTFAGDTRTVDVHVRQLQIGRAHV